MTWQYDRKALIDKYLELVGDPASDIHLLREISRAMYAQSIFTTDKKTGRELSSSSSWRESYCKTCAASITQTLDDQETITCLLNGKEIERSITFCNKHIETA